MVLLLTLVHFILESALKYLSVKNKYFLEITGTITILPISDVEPNCIY
jgi:hypothetical protein